MMNNISTILLLLLLGRIAASPSTDDQDPQLRRPHVRSVTKSSSCQPHHIHLSVGRIQNATHSSMTVSFTIPLDCVKKGAGKQSIGAVRLMPSDDQGGAQEDIMFITGNINSTRTYGAMSPRRDVDRYYSDVYHHIEIEDLRPDFQYSYQCLLLKKQDDIHTNMTITSSQYLRQKDRTTLQTIDNSNIIAQSDISSFTTPPSPGQWPAGRSITFAVIGDLGAKSHSRQTIRHLDQHSEGFDAVLFAGDLAYPSKDHENWDKWMDMMSKLSFFSAIPTQIALGNHDLDTYKHKWSYSPDDTVMIASAYEHRFHMPQVRPAIRKRAVMSGFTADGQPTDFIQYDYGNAYYSVNFVIAGHVHAYMRTHPVAFSRRNPRGPIYLIQGNGGKAVNEPYHNETAEEWVAVRDQTQYGYGTLELCNVTHAKWTLVNTGHDDAEVEPDVTLDELWVKNQLYNEEMVVNKDWEDSV